MPCYDGRQGGGEVRVETVVESAEKQLRKQKARLELDHMKAIEALTVKASTFKDRAEYAEAIVCAIFSDLMESYGDDMLQGVIARASEGGKIDIASFFNAHKDNDKSRLKKELDKFSAHELKVIKGILNE